MENKKMLKMTVCADGSARSERFTSVCECVELTVKGRAAGENAPLYSLFAYNGAGEEILIFEKKPPLSEDGAFCYVHEIDPVSLAVYQNAVSFDVRVWNAVSEGVTVAFVEDFQEAVASRAAVRKKRGPHPLSHVLLIGNSLLLGMENRYGMCSSSPRNDYAYYVSEAIRAKYPDCVIDKMHGSGMEHCESVEAFEAVYHTNPNGYTGRPVCESLVEDLDLIVVQLMDNVNTEKKVEAFHTWAELFLERVRARCPKAEIVWVYGWYHKRAVYPRLMELCKKYDVECVDLRPLRYRANEAESGMLYESADGTMKVASDLWITHPGDGGMRMIGDKIIEALRETEIL